MCFVLVDWSIRGLGSPNPPPHQSTVPFAGDSSVGATPVPIPNTVVKPDSADGTPVARPRESRPSPAPLSKGPLHSRATDLLRLIPRIARTSAMLLALLSGNATQIPRTRRCHRIGHRPAGA